MTSAEQVRRDCPLSAWAGAGKRCQWCDASLTGEGAKRRRTWCSDACFEKFQDQHVWSHAKAAALALAHHRCSIPGCEVTDDLTVVHTTPLGPGRYGLGCQHHQQHLRVICARHLRQARAKARAARAHSSR